MTTATHDRKTRRNDVLEGWHWLYDESIPCTLKQTAGQYIGSVLVRPGHPWHRQQPAACRFQGEPVDVAGGIVRCKPYGSSWLLECEFPNNGFGSRDDAVFELELLAECAAYLEAHRNDRRAA